MTDIKKKRLGTKEKCLKCKAHFKLGLHEALVNGKYSTHRRCCSDLGLLRDRKCRHEVRMYTAAGRYFPQPIPIYSWYWLRCVSAPPCDQAHMLHVSCFSLLTQASLMNSHNISPYSHSIYCLTNVEKLQNIYSISKNLGNFQSNIASKAPTLKTQTGSVTILSLSRL